MKDCGVLNKAYVNGGGVKFDILKFVLAMVIVAMHCGMFPRWILPVARLAVPLFFIMTSYFFHTKLIETTNDVDRRSRLGKFVKRNLHLYLFWSIVLFPFIIILHLNWFNNGALFAIARILKSVFVTGFFGASWFILASVFSVSIVFFLSKYLKNGWLFLISLLVYLLALLDSNYGGLLCPNAYDKLSSLGIRWSLNLPASLIWIVIGKVLAECPLYLPKKAIIPLILLAFGAYYCEYYIIETFGWSVHTDCLSLKKVDSQKRSTNGF